MSCRLEPFLGVLSFIRYPAHVFAPAAERAPLSPKKIQDQQSTAPAAAASAPPANAFCGTPQGANPMAMLKNNLRDRVRQRMEDKISRMPTSPYALLEGETETGSPDYAFAKLATGPATASRKRSAAAASAVLPPAAKYLNGTPMAAPAERRYV